jgi:Sec-independent protein translocase protein TatA
MFNLEPILFVAGGALVFLGPKELPNIARMMGYASGRAVGNVFQAKAKFNQVTKEANLHEVNPPSKHFCWKSNNNNNKWTLPCFLVSWVVRSLKATHCPPLR